MCRIPSATIHRKPGTVRFWAPIAVWVCVTAISSAEESTATKAVRVELEQRTAARDAALQEQADQAALAGKAQQDIDRLQKELAAATARLKETQQARQRAAMIAQQATTAVQVLTKKLDQHRQADALQTAAAAALQRFESDQMILTTHQGRLGLLREEAATAMQSDQAARRQAEIQQLQAAEKQPLLDDIRRQLADAASALESSRLDAIQASRAATEQQRRLSLARLETQRARRVAERLQSSSQAIEASIESLRSVSAMFADRTTDQLALVAAALEKMPELHAGAASLVAHKLAATAALQDHVQSAINTSEAAEVARRSQAETHSSLSRQHFALQREVARLQADSRQQQAISRQAGTRLAELTTEIAQQAATVDSFRKSVDASQQAWQAAQRKADEARRILVTETSSSK